MFPQKPLVPLNMAPSSYFQHAGVIFTSTILICSLCYSTALEAPDIVSVNNEGSTNSLFVNWTPPENATSQRVYWNPANDIVVNQSNRLGPSNSSYTITGLGAGALYNVTVSAYNETQEVTSAITQGRTTPLPVDDLAEMGATNDSVTANWTDPGGTVESYVVECSDGSSVIVESDDGNTTTYNATCAGLPDAGAHYNISVTSQSGNEYSNPTTIAITAYPNSVELSEDSATTRQINISWPDPSGVEERFDVDCGNNGSIEVRLYPNDIVEARFHAGCNVPKAGEMYSIQVISVSGDKESSTTATFKSTRPESVNITETSSNTTAVSVTWQIVPTADNFLVNCSDGAPSPNDMISGTATQASCVGVTPGDNCIISIVTVENNGMSAATTKEISAVPASVILQKNPSTVSSVSASWDMPAGRIDRFVVECSNGTSIPSSFDPAGSGPFIASCTELPVPGAKYDMTVTSISNDLNNSATLTLTALPEAANLTETEATTSSVTASWSLPNGIVGYYEVGCGSGDPLPPRVDDADDRMASCVNLTEPGDDYNITVTSVTNGQRSATSTIAITALPHAVELTKEESNSTAISASWKPPPGVSDGFSVSCSSGRAVPRSLDSGASEYMAFCVDLPTPGKVYRITVVSVSNGKESAPRSLNITALPDGVDLIEGDATTTSVSVSWMKPEGNVERYSIICSEGEPDPTNITDTSRDSYLAACLDLTAPGGTYQMDVFSIVGGETNSSSTIYLVSVPESVSSIRVTEYNTTSVNIAWSLKHCPTCIYSEFQLTHDVNGTTPITVAYQDSETNFSQVVGDLTPGRSYVFTVVSISIGTRDNVVPKTSAGMTVEQRTKPSKITALVIEPERRSLNLAWQRPYGDVTGYNVTIDPNEGDYTFVGTVDEPRGTCTDLSPNIKYTIIVVSVSGDKRSDNVSLSATTLEDVPPAPDPNYDYMSNEKSSGIGLTSFTVELPRDLFNHSNGELRTYDVLVSQLTDDAVNTTNLTYGQAKALAKGGIRPPYITLKDLHYPYPPETEAGSRRRRAAVIMATESPGRVTIGKEDCRGSTDAYCNGPLNDNTKYFYAFRAHNNPGYITSNYFGPVTTVKDNTPTVIGVSVSMSLLAVILLAIGAYILYQRKKPLSWQRRSGGEENLAFQEEQDRQELPRISRKPGSSMYSKSFSKPVLLTNFEEHYNLMKADSEFRFTEEYEKFRLVGKDQPMPSANQTINRPKNRFTNILPYERSRVKMAAIDDEPGTDYINANYMPGYNSPREFVACQGPLPGTMDDMWRMIWERGSTILVMLTQLVEQGRVKCHQYWPEDYEPVTYGNIEVSLQSEQRYQNWTVREFSLLKDDEKRKVTQFHFTSWPDHGVPKETWTMLEFVRSVREDIQRAQSSKPVVVHCSAGVGRTGTYIALDRLMQHMQENDFVDIFGIVCEMRMQRNYMVQTEKQYIFIHECVMNLLQGESIYANVPNGDVNRNLIDEAI